MSPVSYAGRPHFFEFCGVWLLSRIAPVPLPSISVINRRGLDSKSKRVNEAKEGASRGFIICSNLTVKTQE